MKRFTDTDKWTKNRWFRGLPIEYRLFWLFILDSCDMVGVYEVDIDFYNVSQSCSIKMEDAISYFGNRIRVINSGRKWWIVSFCRYQYGELKEDNIKNKPHQRYICELKNHRLWIDYKKTINSLEEKEEDKEKEKEQDKEKEQGIEVPENKKFAMMCMADEMNFIAPLQQKLVNTDYQTELLLQYFDEFNDNLRLTAEPQKEYQDYRRHFVNWITKKMQATARDTTHVGGKPVDRRKHPDFPVGFPYTERNIYYFEHGRLNMMEKA